jgi:hypothetical protein
VAKIHKKDSEAKQIAYYSLERDKKIKKSVAKGGSFKYSQYLCRNLQQGIRKTWQQSIRLFFSDMSGKNPM